MLDYGRLLDVFCRELTLMNIENFTKTYAFLHTVLFMDKKYPIWYRSLVLITNGYPFRSRQNAMKHHINSLFKIVPMIESDKIIDSTKRITEYNHILASVEFIAAQTDHKISDHFTKKLNSFVNDMDEYIKENM